MSAAAIIFVIVLLIALGVGGYFGYTKWFVPNQCNSKGEDTKLHVKTWMWDADSSNCVANVCSDGYGTAATGGSPDSDGNCTLFQIKNTYVSLGSNACSTTGVTVSPVTGSFANPSDCGTDCDAASGCTGFDWDTTGPSCSLVSGGPAALDPTETSGKRACYAPQTSK